MISNSALHYYLIKKIIADGFAPENSELGIHFRTSEEKVVAALLRLQEYHGVVLHPNEPRIWVVHPFSLAPTNFYIRSQKGQWWGNCAWCSLGVAALVNTDLSISTSIGAEGKPITIHIKGGSNERGAAGVARQVQLLDQAVQRIGLAAGRIEQFLARSGQISGKGGIVRYLTTQGQEVNAMTH